MSALPPESDAKCVHSNVRFGPTADICRSRTLPQGGLYFCKSNVSQCEHVAGGADLQPAVILRIHKASVIMACVTVLFEELSFYIANLERVSGNAVLGFENV